jgi:hypothetical protein
LIASAWISSAQNGHFFFAGSTTGLILLSSADNSEKIRSTFFRCLPNVKSPLAKIPSSPIIPALEMPVFSDEEIRTTVLFGAGSDTLIGIFAPHDAQLTPAFASILPLSASEECTLIPSTLGIALSNALNTVCLLKGNSASPELLAALINPPGFHIVAGHTK